MLCSVRVWCVQKTLCKSEEENFKWKVIIALLSCIWICKLEFIISSSYAYTDRYTYTGIGGILNK